METKKKKKKQIPISDAKRRAAARERLTYKVSEAARVAGVGEKAIRDGIKAGTIPSLPFGRLITIPKNAFHRFLDECGWKKTA